MGRKIKTAIIVDFMGGGAQTPEDEIEDHKKRFGEAVLPDKLVVHTPVSAHDIEDGTELVIFDFGGLMPGADSLVISQCRAIIRWAEEHPNGLVVVVSRMTFTNYLQYELQDKGLDSLPNLILDDAPLSDEEYTPVPEWWLGHKPSPATVKQKKLKRPGPPSFNDLPKPRKKIYSE
jgi:hypothetical protein